MLTLNGKRFARDDSEFVESLFHPGGTCVGYYKPFGKSIELMNMRKERIGVINAHGVLCCATKQPCGRYWYSFADIDEIGRYESYSQRIEETRAALEAHCQAA